MPMCCWPSLSSSTLARYTTPTITFTCLVQDMAIQAHVEFGELGMIYAASRAMEFEHLTFTVTHHLIDYLTVDVSLFGLYSAMLLISFANMQTFATTLTLALAHNIHGVLTECARFLCKHSAAVRSLLVELGACLTVRLFACSGYSHARCSQPAQSCCN
jgi:hypothetical protein